ncbi:MAG TPA: hypothetical protein VM429_05050, partial [Micropruina sp.]|nr:hypothetical protein [Micropruina sp.]
MVLVKRRDVLGLAVLIGLGAVLPGCTAPAQVTPSTPGSASASGVSPARPTSTAKPTYEQLARRLSGTLAQPGQTGFRPRALLY